MPIKTNVKDFTPSRVQYARDITLLSGGYSCPTAFPAEKPRSILGTIQLLTGSSHSAKSPYLLVKSRED